MHDVDNIDPCSDELNGGQFEHALNAFNSWKLRDVITETTGSTKKI